jgi:hypothetical protein
LTGLGKPVEIKFTRWFSETKGYMLLRPPTGCGSSMQLGFIDDSYYFLLTRVKGNVRILGWIDRVGFAQRSVVDPVDRKHGQLGCWGVHWKNLFNLTSFPQTSRMNLI